MRLGAGVQNKVLEYMALGLPVVSTSIGLEGFDFTPNEQILIGDDQITFADQVLYLMNSPMKSAHVASAGFDAVVNRYSWQSKLSPMIRKFQEILI